jgi:hypothetical protein
MGISACSERLANDSVLTSTRVGLTQSTHAWIAPCASAAPRNVPTPTIRFPGMWQKTFCTKSASVASTSAVTSARSPLGESSTLMRSSTSSGVQAECLGLDAMKAILRSFKYGIYSAPKWIGKIVDGTSEGVPDRRQHGDDRPASTRSEKRRTKLPAECATAECSIQAVWRARLLGSAWTFARFYRPKTVNTLPAAT